MKHLTTLLLFISLQSQAQRLHKVYNEPVRHTQYGDGKIVVSLAFNYGPAFPYKNNGTPYNAVTSKASIGFVKADLIFKSENSHVDGCVGLRIGGFGFAVSPVSRVNNSDDTTHGMVDYGTLRIMGGGILRLPLSPTTTFNTSVHGGLGVGMGGFLVDFIAFVSGEFYAGVCMWDFVSLGARYVIIPGNFAGFKYNDSRHGMYKRTPDYGIQGVMAELSIKLHKPQTNTRRAREQTTRRRDDDVYN